MKRSTGFTLIERFDSKWQLDPVTGCHVWTAASRTWNGYGIFSQNGRQTTAHRWLWIHHNFAIPRDLDVCHRCDNRLCVNVDHLFVGTRLDNMRDCAAKGRTARHGRAAGESHPNHTLTEEQVRQIRQSFIGDASNQSQLARQFGVSPQQIHRIVHGKSWTHLQEKAA